MLLLSCFAQNPRGASKCQKCGACLMHELLEEALHPAGGINTKFVYEPTGFGEYAYKTRLASSSFNKTTSLKLLHSSKNYPQNNKDLKILIAKT